jgi:formiminoglutamate deiminase
MAGPTIYWCELAWLGGDTATAGVAIEVAGGTIATVTAGAPRPPNATRLDGLTLPGLANAHSHAFHRALRGRTHRGVGSFWTWREQMYALATALDPDSYHRLARATFAEMTLAGFTTVGEFHYLHHGPDGRHYADPNAMGEALIAAADEAGIRITLLDTCYLHAGTGPHGAGLAPEGVQRRFADDSVDAWAERAGTFAARLPAGGDGLHGPHGKARVGAAVHSVRACSPSDIAAVAAWATGAGAPLHAHVSEQTAENEACLAAYGVTPTAVLDAAGALSPAFTAVHATHVTDDDIARLRRTGSTVCLCPTTERDLADGIGRASRFGAVAIGSDSHAVIDPFEEARAIELDERLATNVRGANPVTRLLASATVDGHRALGWPGGVLAAGAPADLVTVSFGSVRLAGTRPAIRGLDDRRRWRWRGAG